MNFFDQAGKMALGSRVRLLSERISADAAEIYRLYGNDLQPKWFPVFYTLSRSQEASVTSIAEHIGHSHVSVSKIVREMSNAGLLIEKTDPKDRRRTKISLSKKGQLLGRNIEEQYRDVGAAIDEITEQATHNLWAALEEWNSLLIQKSLLARVNERRKLRESAEVKIVPYKAKYGKAFYSLNEEWISKYFRMEQPDHDALDNPKEYILDKGGFIYVALLENEPVGVCALLPRPDLKGYELAKMAVSPKAQGKNIGFLLGQAVIAKAREQNCECVFLESNTVLKPAIALYMKLGFKKIIGPPTPYKRCNIQMELRF